MNWDQFDVVGDVEIQYLMGRHMMYAVAGSLIAPASHPYLGSGCDRVMKAFPEETGGKKP